MSKKPLSVGIHLQSVQAKGFRPCRLSILFKGRVTSPQHLRHRSNNLASDRLGQLAQIREQ